MKPKNTHLDRILGKIEDLDLQNLTILVQRLARERKLLETVFNTVREGILVIDRAGVIEYANQAARIMVNLQDRDIGESSLWKLVPDLARSLEFEHLIKNDSISSREVHITYPEQRIVRLYIVPFEEQVEDVHTQCFTVILSDITEDKYQTEEAIEYEKLSSIFLLAAGVAHEIGNPLNSINIHLQLMKRKLIKMRESKQIKSLLESVEACSNEVMRLDGIVTNFLHAIRPVKPSLVDINVLNSLDEVLSLQRHELEDLGILVEVELKTNIPIILADRNQIKQVFFNIIKNAMEAMDKGGKLAITTDLDDEYLYLRFKDTGVGIDEKELTRVFDPYFSTKPGGHGLGLMIVERIMRGHGGKIGIDSIKGEGTCVTLQFPLKDKRTRMLETKRD